ncbi:hypothetical protein COB87_002930 [Candidatus Wolfebacteria bacterium]|nr:hypothetical protein [Candidatus Wolfebacteria bacterium]
MGKLLSLNPAGDRVFVPSCINDGKAGTVSLKPETAIRTGRAYEDENGFLRAGTYTPPAYTPIS